MLATIRSLGLFLICPPEELSWPQRIMVSDVGIYLTMADILCAPRTKAPIEVQARARGQRSR